MEDGRSTSGMVFNLGSGKILWHSKKQDIIALSTNKVEYVVATIVACQCVLLRRMLGDYRLEQRGPTLIWCDNVPKITVAKDLTLHGRTKLIEIWFNFIRNLIAKCVIMLEHCSTEN